MDTVPMTSPAPAKSKKWLYILIVAVVLIGGCFMFVSKGSEQFNKIVTVYVQAAGAQNADAAFALFSTEAQQLPDFKGQLAQLFQTKSALFLDVVSVKTTAFEIQKDATQGTWGQSAGTITYKDGTTSSYQAEFFQESGVWKLQNINVKKN